MYEMKRFIDMEQSPLSRFLLLSTYFCIMIKDFSISFSRVIIVQDFETVFICHLYTILYISTAKPFSLLRGYIEVKINKHEIW